MATTLYKVGWNALSLPGWQSIPKATYYTTIEAANGFAGRLIRDGYHNVYIQLPTNSAGLL